jgi:hypothetical protein
VEFEIVCPGYSAGLFLSKPSCKFPFSCGMAARSGSGIAGIWAGSIDSDCTAFDDREEKRILGGIREPIEAGLTSL